MPTPTDKSTSSPTPQPHTPRPPAPQPPRRRLRRVVLAITVVATVAIVAHGADRRAASPATGHIAATSAAPTDGGWPLRLATFNIHGGRDTEGTPSLDGIEKTLAGFDFVGLNEVHNLGLVRLTDQATSLAARGSATAAFAPSETRWWRPRLGNALLSDLPVRRWRSVLLPNTRGKAYRNLILADVEVNGVVLHALITHVDNYDDHEPQLRQVIDTFLALPLPAVLLGDLNAHADDPLMRELLGRDDVVDAVAAVDADAAPEGQRIDWILLRGLDVTAAGVRDLGASDHSCVWAEVVLPADASSMANVKSSAATR